MDKQLENPRLGDFLQNPIGISLYSRMKLATDAVVIFHFLSQQKSILVNVSLNYFVVVEGNLKLAPCSIKHDRKDRSWNLMYLITIVNLLIPTLFFSKKDQE